MIQVIVLLNVLFVLLFLRKAKLFYLASIVCICMAIPLYTFWIFFTAQKLVEFAFYFLVLGVVFSFFQNKNNS